MMQTMKKLLQSISVRILLLMIFLVLPLNLIAVVFTNQTISMIMDQAEFTMQKMADLQIKELENRMFLGQSFIIALVEDDPNCIAMRKPYATKGQKATSEIKKWTACMSWNWNRTCSR